MGLASKGERASGATLKDVAAHAGVSISTVSNVVNNRRSGTTEETRERVLASIRALNYRPNVAARQLRKAQAGVVAVTVPHFNNPFFSEIVDSICATALARHRTVLIDPTRGERAQELLVVNGLRPHLFDGLILHSLALRIEDLPPDGVPMPIVLFGEELIGAPFDLVEIDNVAAARLATEHLLRIGRRRIAFLGLSDKEHGAAVTARRRLEGYRQALDAAEVPDHERLDVPMISEVFARIDGMHGMRQLLASQAVPDAVLCFNDQVALGAMKVLRDTGYRIPQDIAVVGFDDIEEGRFASPALTTIRPDKAAYGKLLATLLLDRIEGLRTEPPERVCPPFQLIVRQSSGG